jgi:hypothetical protein
MPEAIWDFLETMCGNCGAPIHRARLSYWPKAKPFKRCATCAARLYRARRADFTLGISTQPTTPGALQ